MNRHEKGQQPLNDERQPPPENSGAIVTGIRKMMVPTGRLELPRIAPLAPQASVSTNSTTSATRKNFQGFSGPGCAGWEGAGSELMGRPEILATYLGG